MATSQKMDVYITI